LQDKWKVINDNFPSPDWGDPRYVIQRFDTATLSFCFIFCCNDGIQGNLIHLLSRCGLAESVAKAVEPFYPDIRANYYDRRERQFHDLRSAMVKSQLLLFLHPSEKVTNSRFTSDTEKKEQNDIDYLLADLM
jgi:hypothetical protein